MTTPLVQTAVCRFVVSTTYSQDAGWETAIMGAGTFLGGVGTPAPVSRYANVSEAKAGHKEWVDKITTLGPQALPVVRLGHEAYGVKDEMQFLYPMGNDEYKEAVRSIAPGFGI
ncbi:MAG: hypothetical protein KAJ42_15430 [Gemmatimonadetes bacterium]|nr:hypothetical protein [Gemmatimonadota bacterium]